MTRIACTRILIIFAIFTACTQHPAKAPFTLPGLNDIETAKITTLFLEKNNPTQGNPWSVRLTREPSSADSVWKIASTDQGALSDSYANDGLVRHLIDSLHELKKLGNALEGPLSNFGLDPPQWALRLNDGKEIRFGSPLKEGGVYVALGDSVYGVAGSALSILDRLQTWDILRQNRLISLDYDDIDEVSISPHTHWQRNPSIPNGFFPSRVEFLHALMDTAIVRFIDAPNEISKVQSHLHDVTVTLSGRNTSGSTLQFGRFEGHTYVSVSDRKGAVFEIPLFVFQSIRRIH